MFWHSRGSDGDVKEHGTYSCIWGASIQGRASGRVVEFGVDWCRLEV